MKIYGLAGLLIFGLAACGGVTSDRDRIFKACQAEEGASVEQCNCIADQAEAQLSSEQLDAFADMVEAGDSASENILDDLDPEDGMALMGFLMGAGLSCGLGGF